MAHRPFYHYSDLFFFLQISTIAVDRKKSKNLDESKYEIPSATSDIRTSGRYNQRHCTHAKWFNNNIEQRHPGWIIGKYQH